MSFVQSSIVSNEKDIWTSCVSCGYETRRTTKNGLEQWNTIKEFLIDDKRIIKMNTDVKDSKIVFDNYILTNEEEKYHVNQFLDPYHLSNINTYVNLD